MSDKSRYWWGVLYPENMSPDWKNNIGDILQLPYCYCEHSSDIDSKSEHRKDHIHLIIVFPNTTTYKHAFSVFSLLNANGKIACNTIQNIIGIRSAYDYLIHDTETCKKLGKFLYSPADRVSGNNFDIGCYEQVSLAEKQQLRKELTFFVLDNSFTNYSDLVLEVSKSFDDKYLDVICSYSSHFERLCKGNFLNVYRKNTI